MNNGHPENEARGIPPRFIEINGEKIPVTEEVYRAYKRPLWAEHKRKEREKRCRDENGIRCTKDCSTCQKTRIGSILSLDKLTVDGCEPADQIDMAELVADKLLLEQLTAALDDLKPDERSIIDALFFKKRTVRDYAIDIGISHQAVGKRSQKVLEKLRRLMTMK